MSFGEDYNKYTFPLVRCAFAEEIAQLLTFLQELYHHASMLGCNGLRQRYVM